MYKLKLFGISLFITVITNAQEIKMSTNLAGQNWIRYMNGFKRKATNDRGIMFEYEHSLKRYSWSYNGAIGFSRLAWNQRVDSLNSDTYNTANFLHFRPLGIKKYFRINRVSSYYLELNGGVDYLYKYSQKPEDSDLKEKRMKDLGFSLAGSVKCGLRVAITRAWAFDISINGTENIISNISFDKTQEQRIKFQDASIFITFYRSLKDEKK